jgi:hypothetical protein
MGLQSESIDRPAIDAFIKMRGGLAVTHLITYR